MHKKILLCIGITILFLVVTVRPSFAIEETQEYTLMTPSIFGIKKQQICLTSEQSDKLDSIFDELHEQLKTISSFEETKLGLTNEIERLEKELQGKVEEESRYVEEKALIRSKVDSLLARLEDVTEG